MNELGDTAAALAYGDDVLVGQRVRLRGVREADLASLSGWLMDPAIAMMQTYRALPVSEATAKAKFANWSSNEQEDVGFAVETRDADPVLVGHVSLFGVRPKDGCATLGIGLGREFVGQGYGSDAVRVMVSYGFREMGLHRVQLEVSAFNTAGLRAYARAGFTEEGRRREAIYHGGQWYDDVLMGILRAEWSPRVTR
jgi:RimJ/RimL family protein N-acetyltransferase